MLTKKEEAFNRRLQRADFVLLGWRNLKSKFRANLGPANVCETKKRPQLHVEAIKFDFFGPDIFIFLVRTNFSKKVVRASFGI